MKKSQLREIILETIKEIGYVIGPDGQPKKTDGGSTKTFKDILTTIAKQGMEDKPYTGDAEEGDRKIAKYGNVDNGRNILAKADQEKVAQILRGEEPTYGNKKEGVNEEASTLTVSQVKSEIKGLEPKDIVKIQYVGGSGNTATATNSAENWIKKFDDLDNVKFTKEGEGSYKTAGKLYKSDKSTPPTDRAVRGMMTSKK